MKNRKYVLRNSKHFYSTVSVEHQKIVLPKLKTTPVEEDHIVVYYSDEGMCIFEVLEDTPELLHLNFVSTAS